MRARGLSAAAVVFALATPAAVAATAIDPDFAAVDAAPWKRQFSRDIGKRSVFVGEISTPENFPGSAATLRKAIAKSLSAFGLQASNSAQADYLLSATVFDFSTHEAPQGKTTRAEIGVDYAVADAASGVPLFEQTIRTQFTARAPRKNAAANLKKTLAKTHSRRQLMAALAAEEHNAKAEEFLNVRCTPKDKAHGAVGDGEISAAARKACAQNHAVHTNLEAFFARLLVYRPAPPQASADAGPAERSSKKAQR